MVKLRGSCFGSLDCIAIEYVYVDEINKSPHQSWCDYKKHDQEGAQYKNVVNLG